MTKKNRLILLIVAVGIVFTTVISGTIAWIIAATNEVENTFTIGNVDITLSEDHWSLTDSDSNGVPDAAELCGQRPA